MILTDDERSQRVKGIRRFAWQLLAYYLVTAPVTIPFGLFRWLGEKAEDILCWFDRPAYRWRSAQEELQRELIRDNRRRSTNQRATGLCSNERCFQFAGHSSEHTSIDGKPLEPLP